MFTAWDDDVTYPLYPRLKEDICADVCVVGLGGSGLSAIIEATKRGMSVVGIDSKFVADGAAGRNGGFLLAGLADFYHDARAKHGKKATRIYQYTLDEIKWLKETAPESVNICGVLRIADNIKEFVDCKKHISALQDDGFPVEAYTGKQGEGLLIPTDGVFHPLKRAIKFAEIATSQGAQLFEHTPALSVETGVVTTPLGKIYAKHIIVASDGYLPVILKETSSYIKQTRLQMVHTKPERKLKLEYPVYAGFDYWQQLPDGSIAMGGGRDKSIKTEWTDEREPTKLIRDYLKTRLTKIGSKAKIKHNWAGIVGYTESGMPFVDEVRPNVWGIGGYNGTGNLIGTILGRAVVEHIAEGKSKVLSDFGFEKKKQVVYDTYANHNKRSYIMKSFGLFAAGTVIGYYLGSAIEFFKNLDKNYHFNDFEDFPDKEQK